DPTAECSGTEEKPAGEPGSAEVLLTVGNARGTRLLTTVLYADGWVLTLAEEAPGAVNALTAPRMAPPPPAGRPWQPAYLGSCSWTVSQTSPTRSSLRTPTSATCRSPTRRPLW